MRRTRYEILSLFFACSWIVDFFYNKRSKTKFQDIVFFEWIFVSLLKLRGIYVNFLALWLRELIVNERIFMQGLDRDFVSFNIFDISQSSWYFVFGNPSFIFLLKLFFKFILIDLDYLYGLAYYILPYNKWRSSNLDFITYDRSFVKIKYLSVEIFEVRWIFRTRVFRIFHLIKEESLS